MSIDDQWGQYTATNMMGREIPRDAFIVNVAAFRAAVSEQLMPLAEQNKLPEFVELRNEAVTPIVVKVEQSLLDLLVIKDEAAARALDDSEASESSARTLIIGFILAAPALLVALAIGIGTMIVGPMAKAIVVLGRLADGRLDLQLEVDTKDEIGQMAAALNHAMVKLRDAMTLLGANAQGLAAASAGTEEMSASIREIAKKKNTSDASGVASKAVEIADTARTTVATLGESSTEIGNVTKVINSIAEQTNLWALNATIEAARRGAARRGSVRRATGSRWWSARSKSWRARRPRQPRTSATGSR